MVLSRQLTHLPTLRKIAYGSEPSSKQTLERIRTGLPAVELVHTYGMSEIGILRTRTSPEDASVFALDEEINPGRLRDDLLEVRSMTEMLGYLDRPVPRTEDGWFRTGDLARAEGRYLRVLGRNDETLNVAGHKFLPSELEELILGIGEIADVSVGRERNDLIGEAVVAEIMLGDSESDSDFRVRFKRFCEERIPRHMHPQRLVLSRRSPLGTRLKKTRSHP
jgi:acyl-CoA synthetase (AMP-forming)/AMP-acid ligase II